MNRLKFASDKSPKICDNMLDKIDGSVVVVYNCAKMMSKGGGASYCPCPFGLVHFALAELAAVIVSRRGAEHIWGNGRPARSLVAFVSHAGARRRRGGCGPARSPDPGSPTSLCLLAQDKKRCLVSHAWAFVSGCGQRHSYGTESGKPSRATGGSLRRLRGHRICGDRHRDLRGRGVCLPQRAQRTQSFIIL